ncbi:MAG: HK97 gp10 family phage protein [Clostridium sp.]
MGLDYSELQKFRDNFIKMNKDYSKFLNEFVLKVAMDCLSRTKKRTPVDTTELRRNWFITEVIRKGNDFIVYLYNKKDYATFVEYGHTTRNREDWVEGYYMATISIEELERKLPGRFEKEFTRFMKEKGIS